MSSFDERFIHPSIPSRGLPNIEIYSKTPALMSSFKNMFDSGEILKKWKEFKENGRNENDITSARNWYQGEGDIFFPANLEGKYAGRPLTIRFDSIGSFIASYNPLDNEISAGLSTISLTEESLNAVVSHEQTHEVFSRLSETEQRKLVQAVLEHPEEFAIFYEAIRMVYLQEYFGAERARVRQGVTLLVGKELHVQMQEVVNNGQAEVVDVTCVVDELLAFSNQRTQAQDVLGQNAFMQIICQSAQKIVGLLNADARQLLESKGFFSIDPTSLIEQLMQDREYAKARDLCNREITIPVNEFGQDRRRIIPKKFEETIDKDPRNIIQITTPFEILENN